MEDLVAACVDGREGFPKSQVQLCIAHLVRASMQYVSWRLRKEAAADALKKFAGKGDRAHPAISQFWRRNWGRIPPLFAFPPDIRKGTYPTTRSSR